ncbi:MAG TPA: site-2 protease family protein [Pyrinomonadaceae bacterium]
MSESVQAIPPFVDSPAPYTRRRRARPTAREWKKHGALFFLTVLTATLAGVMLVAEGVPEPAMGEPTSIVGYVFYIPEYYFRAVGIYVQHAFAHPTLLAQGVMFASSLLAILTAHEFGHYLACRRYGVDATLPYFIPAPPLFLAGTFGAFIKIKSPIPTRRALFDIGVAGPLAGFVVAVPVAVIGILTLKPAPPVTSDGILFGDPLLFRLIAGALNIELADKAPNTFYFAAWIGLLVTSLNLMPVGQLDGGHATYSLFGARIHQWLGRVAFVLVASLAILGWVWFRSPSGFLYAVLLGVLLRIKHPRVEDESVRLDRPRQIVALLTLLVFALCFLPFPIKII